MNPPAEINHLSESGSVAEGEMKYFVLEVVAGQPIEIKTEAAGDVDLYIKSNVVPTTSVYDQRGYTATGNERLTFTATANGRLHIGVHGYAASDFRLTTSNL